MMRIATHLEGLPRGRTGCSKKIWVDGWVGISGQVGGWVSSWMLGEWTDGMRMTTQSPVLASGRPGRGGDIRAGS